MRSSVLLLLFATFACHRHQDPAWASIPYGTFGGATVDDAPVPVTRLPKPPVIDGVLDEWGTASVLGPFVDPAHGEENPSSPVVASARVAWDDTHLYVAFVVRDVKPTSPFARDDVDPHIWSKASGVEIVLQPGDPDDNRDYYEIQVDVNGAVFDSHFDDYNLPVSGQGAQKTYGHQDWTSHLERAVHVEPGSFYSVEIALPWSALARGRVRIPPHGGDVWRMNLYSFKDGQAEAEAWSPINGEGNFHYADRWGRIELTDQRGPIAPPAEDEP